MSNKEGVILYFGAAYLPEFYEVALSKNRKLGLLLNTEGAHNLRPNGFEFIEEMPFSKGIDEICHKIKELDLQYGISTIINVDEATVKVWAQVCQRLGYPCMSAEAANTVRDKYMMKECFIKELGSEFVSTAAKISCEEELVRFIQKVDKAIVIKPNCLWGSFFVIKCSGVDESVSNYRSLKKEVENFCSNQRGAEIVPDILAEEYVEGTNHSVECLSLDGEVWSTPVIDVVTGVDIGEDNFHHFARTTVSILSDEKKENLQNLAKKAVKSLGVDKGATHVEFIYSETGPKVVEIGGRPGVNRIALLNKAYSIDYLQGYIDVLEGRKPEIIPCKHGAAAVVTPYPKYSGVLKGINRLEEIKSLDSAEEVSENSAIGDEVKTRQEGGWPLVRVDIMSDDIERFNKDFARLTELSKTLYSVEPS